MIDFLLKYWLEVLFGICISICGFVMKNFNKKVKKFQATERGVQALLRNSIIQTYNSAMHNGYLKIYERENVEHMFEEYTALGGNGVVKGLIEKMYQLPTEPPEEKE